MRNLSLARNSKVAFAWVSNRRLHSASKRALTCLRMLVRRRSSVVSNCSIPRRSFSLSMDVSIREDVSEQGCSENPQAGCLRYLLYAHDPDHVGVGREGAGGGGGAAEGVGVAQARDGDGCAAATEIGRASCR